jgi:hypothetical protein
MVHKIDGLAVCCLGVPRSVMTRDQLMLAWRRDGCTCPPRYRNGGLNSVLRCATYSPSNGGRVHVLEASRTEPSCVKETNAPAKSRKLTFALPQIHPHEVPSNHHPLSGCVHFREACTQTTAQSISYTSTKYFLLTLMVTQANN